jgi:RNase adapter protein RapZ
MARRPAANEKKPVRPVKDKGQPAGAEMASGSAQLVVITGISGSGKGTALRVFEDLGYYCVDHLPVDLIPKFAELVLDSPNIRRAALVVDIREGDNLAKFPAIFRQLNATALFLEADDDAIQRRFSETRRPHPLGRHHSVITSLQDERKSLQPIRSLADHIIDSTKYSVHELRQAIEAIYGGAAVSGDGRILIGITSFGFRWGVPTDADLVFDVRFLPNPNFQPHLKKFTGRHPAVAKFIRSFPQTGEFIERITDLLVYLLPHYIKEGKSYLTIAFGCTGGHHRSVMIADDVHKRLTKAGFQTKVGHRDMTK